MLRGLRLKPLMLDTAERRRDDGVREHTKKDGMQVGRPFLSSEVEMLEGMESRNSPVANSSFYLVLSDGCSKVGEWEGGR
jgi:hypothetical protein